MSMIERLSFDFNNYLDVKATFVCVSEIMELYLEHELEPDPLKDFFIDCFTPLSEIVQTDLSYGSFCAFLKSIIGTRKEPDWPPMDTPNSSAFGMDDLDVTPTDTQDVTRTSETSS